MTGLVEPHSIEAEESVLGAMLVSEAAIPPVIGEVRLTAEDFYRGRHATIYTAIHELYDRSQAVDALTVVEHLKRQGKLEDAGGPAAINSLAASTPAPSHARHHAGIILEHALDRELDRIGRQLAAKQLTVADARAALAAVENRREAATAAPDRLVQQAGSYLLDTPTTAATVWGAGDQVLWAAGEPLLINAPQGAGKTTLTQQLMLARAGVREPRLLGLPVAPDDRPVLYVAADRPEQARRSLARMVGARDREALDERLRIWRGPLPFDVTSEPHRLAEWLQRLGVGTIAVDSLKDMAIGLSEDAVGAAVNQAIQGVVAADIEFAACHHQRKAQDGRKPNHLDDVYGSTWLTAGAGSVVLLWGSPGDSYVELSHLKQPISEVGPLQIHHDHEHGRSTIPEPVDLLDLAASAPLEVADAARQIYDTDSPDRNQIERARRRLEKLAADGKLERCDPGDKKPVSYICRVIARDTSRDASRSASRPITDTPEPACSSITQGITGSHAPPEGTPPPPKGGVGHEARDGNPDDALAADPGALPAAGCTAHRRTPAPGCRHCEALIGEAA